MVFLSLPLPLAVCLPFIWSTLLTIESTSLLSTWSNHLSMSIEDLHKTPIMKEQMKWRVAQVLNGEGQALRGKRVEEKLYATTMKPKFQHRLCQKH